MADRRTSPQPPPSSAASRLVAWVGMLASAAVVVGLAFAVAVTVVVGPVGQAAAGAFEFGLRTPDEAAFDPLGERSVVYDGDGNALAVLHDEVDRLIVPLDDVPGHVQHAVLAAEDRRFYEHDGYDVEGIGRALLANLREQRVVQGGSTITQQLAKQNFVGDDVTLDRKLSELLYAVALEEEFTKDELLERYLNQVYFGSGAYGIAAAAEEFFEAAPSDLTVEQGALLAGMIRAPGQLDPRRNPDGAMARRNVVLAGMAQEGHLDPDEAERLQHARVHVLPDREREVREPYVVEAIKREFFANPAFGETREERITMLFTGGLRIKTTINPRLQEIAHAVVAEAFPPGEGPTAAIASVDPRTGRVLALHAGADFAEEQFDLATQGRRQPGSAFKPFVLAAALEQGYPLRLVVEGDSPVTFDQPGWNEPWTVSNYGGASYGPIDLREALVRSSNTAFASLQIAVGMDPVKDLGERMGFDMDRVTSPEDGPAIAIGGMARGVTPLEMAAAYGTLTNAGMHLPPFLIDRVENRRGELIFQREPEPQYGTDPAVAAVLTDVMQDVVTSGTGTRARLPGWQPAGKTGTAQEHADAWFVGSVPVLSTAVWVGHPNAQVPMPGMTGGSVPATLWRQFMEAALEGLTPVPFLVTDADVDSLVRGEAVTVPDVRRMERQEAIQELLEDRLVAAVRSVPSTAPAGIVVWQSPGPGTEATAGSQVTVAVSTGQPPPPEPEPDEDPAEEGDEEPAEGDEPPPEDAGPPPDDDGSPPADDAQDDSGDG